MYYTIQPVYNLKINRYIITGKHTAWVKVDTSYYQDRFWVPLIYMYSSSPYTIQGGSQKLLLKTKESIEAMVPLRDQWDRFHCNIPYRVVRRKNNKKSVVFESIFLDNPYHSSSSIIKESKFRWPSPRREPLKGP